MAASRLSRITTAIPRVSTRVVHKQVVNVPEPSFSPPYLMTTVYTARAIANPSGRSGTVELLDYGSKRLQLRMQPPPVMGGRSAGYNPEQLVAAGYASCFASALRYAASLQGKLDAVRNARTCVDVALGHPEKDPGFGVEVKIAVEGCDDDALISAAHDTCPYSRFARGNRGIRLLKS